VRCDSSAATNGAIPSAVAVSDTRHLSSARHHSGVPAVGLRKRLSPFPPFSALSFRSSTGAAVHRSRDGRDAWHPEQRISAQEALDASTRTRIAVGEVADLVLVESDPLDADVETLRNMKVAATFIAGRPTHLAL
jgi:hypothetical protein